MRLWAFVILWSVCAGWSLARESIPPRAPGRVTDLARVLDARTVRELEQSLQGQPNAVTVVVIPRLADFSEPSIEALAARWHREWKLGARGVLLMLSINDHKARIQLGPAWPASTHPQSDAIMTQTIIPACKRGDFAGALRLGSQRLTTQLGQQPSPAAQAPASPRRHRSPDPPEPPAPKAVLDYAPQIVGTLLGLSGLLITGASPTARVTLLGAGGLILVAWYGGVVYVRKFLVVWGLGLGIAVVLGRSTAGMTRVRGGLGSLAMLTAAALSNEFMLSIVFLLFVGLLLLGLIQLFGSMRITGPNWGGGGGGGSDSGSSSYDSSSDYSSSSYSDSGGSTSSSGDSGSTGSW